MKTRLLEIINAGANKLTKDDKIFIKTTALELGMPAPVGSCKNCYIDLAVFVVKEIEIKEEKEKEQENIDLQFVEVETTAEDVEASIEPVEIVVPAEPAEERKIFIKKGVDILVNGRRVNRYTITTDAEAEALMKIIDKKYFEIL
jgi:hypothetical protein